ncbi:hypothetical protein [Maribacter polysaccharolyticus]|uniref:hypothetical protein n=1 Tax=Maribacter polysaccharolyticus TaxID=3020831 RepID=UPI00237F8F70|nr:hypothetical protein [Maribacter polysaccharolyticus]MDE3740451.1 hypothetical protein [Maribacter polysaccharolyticus]
MMWFFIGSLLIAVIIVYLLFLKMKLYINTDTRQYYLQVVGIVKASVEADKERLVRIHIRTFFMNFYVYPLEAGRRPKKKKKISKPKVSKGKSFNYNRILRIIRTFKVNRLVLDIDTGNCITNAKLYPLCGLSHLTNGQFNINFQGRNQLILQLDNRPIRIIKAFINN